MSDDGGGRTKFGHRNIRGERGQRLRQTICQSSWEQYVSSTFMTEFDKTEAYSNSGDSRIGGKVPKLNRTCITIYLWKVGVLLRALQYRRCCTHIRQQMARLTAIYVKERSEHSTSVQGWGLFTFYFRARKAD
jgi:hypothetical protein